jgi:alkanesulfonate monooxygenase SsuD/methylene tetrahydromethanopterin reductase-like flavin-dependent oxidoreductase (luciferase family)
VIFLPFLPPERLRPVAEAADQAGLAELWLWEDCFQESGIATAAAALAWTTRLRVGVGLLPVPLRNVALTAMELATMERLFPGRLIAGVGHGVAEWMEQVGAGVSSPMTLLREYVGALSGLLAGQTVTTAGRYVSLQDVRLDWPPSPPPPVLVGAVGPKSLALSGELADGTILSGRVAPADIRVARQVIDGARAAAGAARAHNVVAYLPAATGPGAQERPDRELAQWSAGRDAGVAGDAAVVAAAVRLRAEAGADTVVLQPTRDDPDLEGFVRFVATEVAALV